MSHTEYKITTLMNEYGGQCSNTDQANKAVQKFIEDGWKLFGPVQAVGFSPPVTSDYCFFFVTIFRSVDK